jgi:hypothetical protein
LADFKKSPLKPLDQVNRKLVDASYQVSVHLAEEFQRRRLKCEKITDDRRHVMAKAHIGFGKAS